MNGARLHFMLKVQVNMKLHELAFLLGHFWRREWTHASRLVSIDQWTDMTHKRLDSFQYPFGNLLYFCNVSTFVWSIRKLPQFANYRVTNPKSKWRFLDAYHVHSSLQLIQNLIFWLHVDTQFMNKSPYHTYPPWYLWRKLII